jgi:UDP-N-acetylmuramate dehydrogenase
MYILPNVPLQAFSTMRLGGKAAYITDVSSRNDIVESVAWAEQHQLPIIMIGGGSNIVWSDDGFPGLVMVNKIQGIEVQEAGDTQRYVSAGGGVVWDELVNMTVEQGMTGLEFLSLIPGTVGATPVQNVGAYGQEVSTSIVTIEAYDTQTKSFVTLHGSDCEFGYRTSRFKTTDHGRYVISGVTFFLNIGNPQPPYYGAVEQYRVDHGIKVITPQIGREATIAIRQSKLPDPAIVANTGSFFGNPTISSELFFQLRSNFPDMPQWPVDSKNVKISAAWLIEHAGFKDYHDTETGMATWAKQPLVLVNEHANSTAQLLAFKQKIVGGVQDKFGITLVQEPEFIG